MAKVPEANRVVWNASKRAAYAKYLGVDLTGYDVHHIIPREYGGTNDYSNLIPLAVSDHRTVTSWWVITKRKCSKLDNSPFSVYTIQI